MDCHGRVADAAIFQGLGWTAGDRLSIDEAAGALIVRPSASGGHRMTGQGHLQLPARLRHAFHLMAGDRLLLAADPIRNVLLVHPPAVLDDLLAARYADLFHGASS